MSPALIDAAAEAMWRADGYDFNADPTSRVAEDLRDVYEEQAKKVVEALSPLIRASIVADIQEMKAPEHLVDAHQATYLMGVSDAAAVAGGEG